MAANGAIYRDQIAESNSQADAQTGFPFDEEDRPWLKFYNAGVPHTLKPYPEHTLLDIVRQTAAQKPAHPAMLFMGNRIPYKQFAAAIDTFAAALAGLGVRPGDRVVLMLPNTPQTMIGQYAAWAAGAIAAPLNPLYTEHELVHVLNDCGAETAVVLTQFYGKIKAVQSKTPLKKVIAVNIKDYLPPGLRVMFTLMKEKKEGHRIQLQPGDFYWHDLMRQFAGKKLPEVRLSPQDPATLLYSGGTTGIPKGAIGTHAGLLATGLQIHSWFTGILDDWQDVIMANMPFFHTYGNCGVMAAGIVGHNPLVLVPNPRDLDGLLDTIQKIRPAFLPGVPTLFIALLNHPRVLAGKVNFNSIKLSISGAAPLLNETRERFEAITGGKMIEAYALTETLCGPVISLPGGVYKNGSTGIPVPDMVVRIVDADTGQTLLSEGEVGEVILKSPNLMQGYWQRPEESAETIRSGWLFTGDLGYLDQDGFLFIVDRKKDLIKPSGFQVWPREVEEVIAMHPAVSEVGVAGIPDPTQAEAVKAWIVLREGAEVSEREIRQWCRDKLIAYKVPKFIEFRDSLPKSTVGKVLRRELTRNVKAE